MRVEEEKFRLPVDVRGPKTSVLKLLTSSAPGHQPQGLSQIVNLRLICPMVVYVHIVVLCGPLVVIVWLADTRRFQLK